MKHVSIHPDGSSVRRPDGPAVTAHHHRPAGTIDARTGPHFATCTCGTRIRATEPGREGAEWISADHAPEAAGEVDTGTVDGFGNVSSDADPGL